MTRFAQIADIFLAKLPQRDPSGHEQEGIRPVIIVARPHEIRFPMSIVIPLTSKIGPWRNRRPDIYPIFDVGQGGLTLESVALIDHVQGMDEVRLIKRLGRLTESEYQPVRDGLLKMLEPHTR